MLKQILASALGAIALTALATAASAQAQYGQPQYQQPQYSQPQAQPQYGQQPQYGGQPQYQQPQVSQPCVRLESQLATLDSQNQVSPQQQQLEANYNQQRQEMDRMIARSRGMGCGRNFLFGPRPPRECRGLEAQIDRMRDNVERLGAQLQRGRGDSGLREARRRDIITALAHHQCGPQYVAAAPQREERRGGLFGLLFGNRGLREPSYPQGQMEVPQTSTFRTVCVRTCDGFFFPVSYATVPARFGQDENMCRRTCPGAEAMLFTYPTGTSIEQATSTTGQPYSSLPNAFKYQTEYVKDCSCKPANMTWAEALAGAEDGTVQSGDIIVDEERSRDMSQPQGGQSVSPTDAARAAQDSANDVTSEGVVEGAANTGPEPGAPIEQPDGSRVAEPYYMPSPTQAAPPPPNYPQQPQQQQREPVYVPPQFR